MALNRRNGQRFQASIWPGFVDAMTALLLVLIFVLTIFMAVQSIQSETITGQESELDRLGGELDALSRALGAEQSQRAALEDRVEDLGFDLEQARQNEDFQSRLIAALNADLARQSEALTAARGDVAAFEAQVAELLLQRDAARDEAASLSGKVEALEERGSALDTALAAARDEIDAGAEAARLAAARREALEALVADLETTVATRDETVARLQGDLDAAADALSAEEAARLADAAAAEALRARLAQSDAELTAMTLSLENERRAAEETLTLLAAARAAEADLDARLVAALAAQDTTRDELETARAALTDLEAQVDANDATATDLRARLTAALAAKAAAEAGQAEAMDAAEQRAVLLATARRDLDDLAGRGAEDQRRLAALNAQVADLRRQIGGLQSLLDDARAKDVAADVQINALGAQLNTALARVAAEERARAELEAAERARLEREARQLENYRSEFFGRLRDLLGEKEGVQIVGDRFVFSSEVLFESGAAELSSDGRREIANVAGILQEVAAAIPPEIDWVIRVDGHTDNVPVSPGGRFADNWELSQARALSVVRYMVDAFGFPPDRLVAAGFGEYQPVDPADTPEARARNRRIELKLTEG